MVDRYSCHFHPGNTGILITSSPRRNFLRIKRNNKHWRSVFAPSFSHSIVNTTIPESQTNLWANFKLGDANYRSVLKEVTDLIDSVFKFWSDLALKTQTLCISVRYF